MASVSITISNPTLGVGEKFVERHRLLPSGTFTAWTDRTNLPFVLSLTEGLWEIEIAFVKADGTQCTAVRRTVETVDPPVFTVIQLTNPARLSVSYTGGTGTSPCGYRIEYRAVGTTTWAGVNYATIPASPFPIALPIVGKDIEYRIMANQCNGYTICDDGTAEYPAPPECVEMSGFDYIVTPIEQPMQGKKAYRVTLTATTQSTVPTTSASFRIDQGYTLAPALPWGTTFPVTGISATAFSVTFVVYHNFPYGAPTPPIYWVLKFNDACGYLHNINIDYP
jgi:hypothetical protein